MKKPRIIVLLSWYEESASWLAATIGSTLKFADHVVAVDGAYALFPESKPRSGAEQAETIQQLCHGAGVGCTIHVPQERWYGNEVEKRAFMFKLAETVSEPDDWYFIIDGDTVVTEAPDNLAEALGSTKEDTAVSLLWERDDPHSTPEKSEISRKFESANVYRGGVRMMFRALRGLTVEQAHYVYSAPCPDCDDGCPRCMQPVVPNMILNRSNQKSIPGTPGKLWLWGSIDTHRMQPFCDLHDVVQMEHRNRYRDLTRARQAHSYYAMRGEHELEKIEGAPEIAAVDA